jgi:hypothetical protein
MSVFSKILEALGFGKKEDPKPDPSRPRVGKSDFMPAKMEVDVVGKLDGLAKSNAQKLEWRVSIVDLLKLLDIDSSLDNRKELATELGVPPDKMGGDHAEMNMWLHKAVMKKLADNGGNVPKDLLD